MASALTTAHGQSKSMGGILHSTTQNAPRLAAMKGLDHLIQMTTGIPLGEPGMHGVITDTIPPEMRAARTPDLLPMHEKDVTGSKMAVGIPYAGAKSGYGGAKKSSGKKGK